MIRSGARRLLALVAVLVAASAAAALLGIATGAGVARSVSLGCYVVGALAGFIGFALGSRALFRPRLGEDAGTMAADELRESRAVAALLMIAGVGMVMLGVAIDPHAQLV